jgi:hypothetical protein
VTQPDPREAPALETVVDGKPAIVLRDPDDIHYAWLVGFTEGYAQGRRAASSDLAHELLHERAAETAGSAVASARNRHGYGWADEIRRGADAS